MFYKTHRFEGIEPGCGGDMTMGVITGGAFDVVPSSSANQSPVSMSRDS